MSHKDLRGDHEDLEGNQNMIKDTLDAVEGNQAMTHEWLEKIETAIGELEPGGAGPVCPEAGGTPVASGRYVTYEADDPDPKKVCDRRTGVFYEQSPSTDTFAWSSDGVETEAQDHCEAIGPGWRLPTYHELIAVVDVTIFNPAVNLSVFSNVQSSIYWSASPFAATPSLAWNVNFLTGTVAASTKTNVLKVWCVRSGL